MTECVCRKEKDGYALPVEVFGIVGKQLIADGLYGTCAALNLTCQAVHEETLQELWRTVVHWGVKMFAKVPLSVYGANPGERTTKLTGAWKEVLDQWSLLVHSRGAKYIEYLIGPNFGSETSDTQLFCERMMEPTVNGAPLIFPKLKAMITLHADSERQYDNDPGLKAGVFISLTNAYRCGGNDLVQLAVAVKMLYDLGDDYAKRLLSQRLYIPLLQQGKDHKSRTKTFPISERWNYSQETQDLWQSIFKVYRPGIIMVITPSFSGVEDLLTDHELVDPFLDMLYWLSRGGESFPALLRGGVIELCDLLPKRMMCCVRAGSIEIINPHHTRFPLTPPGFGLLPCPAMKQVQKATFHNPSMSMANWELSSLRLPLTASAFAEIEKILAVSRGIYLRAAKTIDKSLLGSSVVRWNTDGTGFAVFMVGDPGDVGASCLTSWIQLNNSGPRVLWHKDPW